MSNQVCSETNGKVQKLCGRCGEHPVINHPKTPNAEICSICFWAALADLFFALDEEFGDEEDVSP
jgi:hypothetical protein